jgi:hypothetical protein
MNYSPLANLIFKQWQQIIGAWQQPTKQHFILFFSALKEVEEDEFDIRN